MKEGKEDKENYILINFNGALEFIFNTYDFTEEEMGIILTTFLENNIKIINSKPYYYVEGIVGRKSYQEIVQDVKQCNPSFLILPNNTKEKYSEKLNEQIMSSEIKRKELVRTYGIILDFLTKEEKQEADYQNIYSILKSLQMPKFMIKIFLSYQGYEKKQAQPLHLEAFKRPIKQETKKSKKELKTALQSYLASENFDYANYEDVVSILRQLNYPETQITNVMYELFNKAIINYAYYKYIYKKYAMLYPKEPILKEILDMASAMMIPESEEDYIFWKNQIIALLEKMQGEAQTNDAYDLKRVYCPKK